MYNYYSGVANPTACTSMPKQAASGNNGNMAGYFYQDSYNSAYSHAMADVYDSVNRLTSSTATGNAAMNLTFGYDQFGNMTCTGGTGLCGTGGNDPPCPDNNTTTVTVNGNGAQAPTSACQMAGDGGASCQTALDNAEAAAAQAAANASGNSSGSGTPGRTPQAQAQNNACTEPILNAVNNQFGTNFTPDNLQGPPFRNGQAMNLNILGNGLPPAQFNSIQTGRYPVNWWSYVIGYGPTLHITGQGLFDPAPAGFTNSNVGGVPFVLFTAHIDTSFAYNPIGALIHLFTDLLHIGRPRNPCP